MATGMTSIGITEFRLSLIWFETNLALLSSNEPPRSSSAYLGREFGFAEKFDEVKQNPNLGMTPP